MIYAVPEIRSDALRRAYVEDIFGRPFIIVRVQYAKQAAIDDLKVGVPQVKVAGRVT